MLSKYFLCIFHICFFMLNSSLASSFVLSEGVVESYQEKKVSYSYSWKKVRDLTSGVRSFLDLSFSDRKLSVLEARFVFYIRGDASRYKEDFFSNRETLEGLSGMKHQLISLDKYRVEDINMGIKIRAEVSLEFDLDYGLLQDAFNYSTSREHSFVVHQKGRAFSKFIRSTDIISHISQQGEYVKVSVDSYAIILKKGTSRYLSFAIKKIMVRKMKKQILKSPLIFLNY